MRFSIFWLTIDVEIMVRQKALLSARVGSNKSFQIERDVIFMLHKTPINWVKWTRIDIGLGRRKKNLYEQQMKNPVSDKSFTSCRMWWNIAHTQKNKMKFKAHIFMCYRIKLKGEHHRKTNQQ